MQAQIVDAVEAFRLCVNELTSLNEWILPIEQKRAEERRSLPFKEANLL